MCGHACTSTAGPRTSSPAASSTTPSSPTSASIGWSRAARPCRSHRRGDWFYADCSIDPSRQRLVCVREDHTAKEREPVTTLVSLPLAGPPAAGEVIVSGHDFYSTPRFSPDGSRLSWLAWRHPNMPWDGTELWVANVSDAGTLDQPRQRGRRRDRRDLSARMVPGRNALLRLGSHGLVESLSRTQRPR